MTRELYVYFRASTADAGAVRSAVTAMQTQLRHDVPGLRARLLLRAGEASAEPAALQTWMETYAAGSDGVCELLAQTIEQRAAEWASLCHGPRHVEVFDACV